MFGQVKQDNKHIYKHIPTGMFLLLEIKRKTDINTYVDCDELGSVIYKTRKWSMSKKTHSQQRIIKGFDNLIRLI